MTKEDLLNMELSIYNLKEGFEYPENREAWEKVTKDPKWAWEFTHTEHSIRWCLFAPTNPENWVWLRVHDLEGRVFNLEGTMVRLSKAHLGYAIEPVTHNT